MVGRVWFCIVKRKLAVGSLKRMMRPAAVQALNCRGWTWESRTARSTLSWLVLPMCALQQDWLPGSVLYLWRNLFRCCKSNLYLNHLTLKLVGTMKIQVDSRYSSYFPDPHDENRSVSDQEAGSKAIHRFALVSSARDHNFLHADQSWYLIIALLQVPDSLYGHTCFASFGDKQPWCPSFVSPVPTAIFE